MFRKTHSSEYFCGVPHIYFQPNTIGARDSLYDACINQVFYADADADAKNTVSSDKNASSPNQHPIKICQNHYKMLIQH